jgi:hypothetical protein
VATIEKDTDEPNPAALIKAKIQLEDETMDNFVLMWEAPRAPKP